MIYALTILCIFIIFFEKKILVKWFFSIFLLHYFVTYIFAFNFGFLGVISNEIFFYQETYIRAINYSGLSLITIYLVYALFKINSLKIKLREITNVNKLSVYTFSLIGFCSLLILIQTMGGVSNILSNVEFMRSGQGQRIGFLMYPATMFIPLSMIFYLALSKKSCSLTYMIVFFISLIPIFMLGFRGPILILLIQFVTLYHLKIKQLDFSKTFLLLVFAICFFTLYAFFREGLSIDEFLLIFEIFLNSVLLRVRGIEYLSQIILYGSEYNYFIPNIVETATIVIPSAVFPEKPISTTEMITTLYFKNELYDLGIIRDVYGGVSSGFLSHGYWSAGLLGVLSISIFSGFILGLISKLHHNNVGILLIATFISYVHLYIESFQLAINSLVMNFLAMLIFIIIKNIFSDAKGH